MTKTVPNIGITTFDYDIISGMDEGCYKEVTTDPKGNVTIKVFDRAGRLKTVTADGKTTTYNYYDNGARENVIYNDGTKDIAIEEYTYYDNGLLWTDDILRPNVKELKFNINPKTGESFQNGYNIRPAAEPNELPKQPK